MKRGKKKNGKAIAVVQKKRKEKILKNMEEKKETDKEWSKKEGKKLTLMCQFKQKKEICKREYFFYESV